MLLKGIPDVCLQCRIPIAKGPQLLLEDMTGCIPSATLALSLQSSLCSLVLLCSALRLITGLVKQSMGAMSSSSFTVSSEKKKKKQLVAEHSHQPGENELHGMNSAFALTFQAPLPPGQAPAPASHVSHAHLASHPCYCPFCFNLMSKFGTQKCSLLHLCALHKSYILQSHLWRLKDFSMAALAPSVTSFPSSLTSACYSSGHFSPCTALSAQGPKVTL